MIIATTDRAAVRWADNALLLHMAEKKHKNNSLILQEPNLAFLNMAFIVTRFIDG